MDKKLFGDLVASLSEAKAIACGQASPSRKFVVEATDVKAIREGVQMTRCDFADALGVNVATLSNWESGHSRPRGPARVLLTIVHLAPKVFFNAVGARAPMRGRRRPVVRSKMPAIA